MNGISVYSPTTAGSGVFVEATGGIGVSSEVPAAATNGATAIAVQAENDFVGGTALKVVGGASFTGASTFTGAMVLPIYTVRGDGAAGLTYAYASCGATGRVIGGGCEVFNQPNTLTRSCATNASLTSIDTSATMPLNTGWTCDATATNSIRAHAICLTSQ